MTPVRSVFDQNMVINPPIYPVPIQNNSTDNHQYGKGIGRLSIWSNCNECNSINIYINDTFVGVISAWFNSQPDCNSKGIFSVTRPIGLLKITALGMGKKWEGFVNILEDKCLIQELSK